LILRLQSGRVLQCSEEGDMDMSPILQRVFSWLGVIVIQAVFLLVNAKTLNWSAGWWYIGLYFNLSN
jgi:hypothetical protein